METKVPFEGLDFSASKPTSVPMDIIEVEITSENLFGDFGAAFVKEGYRVNPLRAEQIDLTSTEMACYIDYLVRRRIESVMGTCRDFRKLKALYIPSWIQYNLSMIGVVYLRDRGIKLVPVIEENENELTYAQALAISEKIGMFIDDLQIVQDAMPRAIDGDVDVMSTALIAGYVRALSPVQHPISTYVTAFMGMKLREEAAMGVLYRVQYDDIAFISSALITQRGLYS